MPTTYKMMSFQDSASPLMEQLIFFHDHTLIIIIIIMILISQLLISIILNKYTYRFLLSGQLIEMIWTILPAIILVTIALPSLHLLYLLDETNNPMMSIKVIGHQWYWSYEYSDYPIISYNSYMIPSNKLEMNQFRLLDTNNRLTIPYNTQIRLIVTSMDVIHSWAIPSLGVKIDAIPGRLNQVNFYINRPGVFFGQCSEICGSNHSFMPITLESISSKKFLNWVKIFYKVSKNFTN